MQEIGQDSHLRFYNNLLTERNNTGLFYSTASHKWENKQHYKCKFRKHPLSRSAHAVLYNEFQCSPSTPPDDPVCQATHSHLHHNRYFPLQCSMEIIFWNVLSTLCRRLLLRPCMLLLSWVKEEGIG